VDDATVDPHQVETWWGQWPDANVGVATGRGSGFVVLDIDPGHGGDESLAELVKKHGGLPDTLWARTGSGGRHILFLAPAEEVRNRVGFEDGLDFRGDKGYIVAPSSNHISGGVYEWQGEFKLAPMPKWLLAAVRDKAVAPRPGDAPGPIVIPHGERNNRYTELAGVFLARGLTVDAALKAILDTNAEQEDPSPPRDVEEIVRGVYARYPAGGGFQTVQKGVRSGQVCHNQHNIRLAMLKLGHKLQHDAFCDRLLIDGGNLNDAAMARLYLEVEREFKFRPPKDYFWMVTEDLARTNAFHPVRDYLDSLQWDGTPRVEEWLIRFGNAADSAYIRAISRIVLVAAVRRVRRPGCKFDEMLVLESDQGLAKSSALAILAVRSKWFCDDLPLNADSKRTIEQLQGHWIIEASDLAGLRRSDVDHLKATLSRRVDKARLAYGRLVTEVPRQSIIVGTTNNRAYLWDTTGNRRFWPATVGKFDLAGLARARDQLWAEAARMEADGASIRLATELWDAAAAEQEERRVEDPFAIQLEAVLGTLQGKLAGTDVWTIVGVPMGQRNQQHNVRIGEAMRRLGWARAKRRFGHAPEWGWVRGPEEAQKVQLVVRETEKGPVALPATDGVF
jgi:predicted P-loop ATPase